MLNLFRGIFSVALSFPFLAMAATAQDSAKDIPSAIIAMERAALDLSDKGDVSRFLEISDEDVTYIDPSLDKPIYGLEALRTYYRQFPAPSTPIHGEMVNSKVQVIGKDGAVLTFNYVQNGVPVWNCTEVYRRTNKGWRIVQTHWSYIKSQRASR